jgi:ribosomal protein S17E
MKWILPAILGLALAPMGLIAQTAVKRTAQPTDKNPPALLSDQEKNLRTYIELLRTDVRKHKAEVMGIVMQLDAEESAAFWPIYLGFEANYMQIGEGIVALIKSYAENYDSMTGEVADQLATRLLNLEQQRNDLKRKYYEKFRTALNPITATRFLQVENQLEHVIDLQIASELPVISGPQRSQQ